MPSPVRTPFTARSTAVEVVNGIDLSDRRAIVTGGASGIGIETARALAVADAEVTLAVRNLAAGHRAAEDIAATTGGKQVLVAALDLADQASVSTFAAAWGGPLHILVNNAGVMATPKMRTPEGWELQFATNHLGHFALTVGLHRALAADGARVVAVSSNAHLRSPLIFDDIHFLKRPYHPWGAYGQSKTANILFAVDAARRWAGDGITVNALMPGAVRTNLGRYVTGEDLDQMRARGRNGTPGTWKSPGQGAATSVLVATSPLLDGISGRYFENCNVAGPAQPGTRRGVAAHAMDPEAAARLWQVSVEATATAQERA
ncbi:SDR family NAD(P)-dependent oxidoreductase [Streptomyces sp. 2A115]|uniref:SDR family NAD(P)-dependent oxidoreductase n=1 Tax=Streptomyces sp. 2A115 TaxID=3457439 RepID=UPI003FCF9CA6